MMYIERNVEGKPVQSNEPSSVIASDSSFSAIEPPKLVSEGDIQRVAEPLSTQCEGAILSKSKISNPYSLVAMIEKSRSRSTTSLLLENFVVTASCATLCYLTSKGLKDFVEGVLGQPPVIKLGVLPLGAVFTLSAISVVMWSITGVALIERGWKGLLSRINLGDG